MTFKELYTIVLERVDEDVEGTDELILAVVKNGVNEGYLLVATTLDKTTDEYISDYDQMIELPANCAKVTRIDHEVLGTLSVLDYNERNDRLYMCPIGITTGEITISYTKYPTKLVEDTDVVRLKAANCSIPAIYGAYEYMLHRKKYAAAQMLQAEFFSHLPKEQAK